MFLGNAELQLAHYATPHTQAFAIAGICYRWEFYFVPPVVERLAYIQDTRR